MGVLGAAKANLSASEEPRTVTELAGKDERRFFALMSVGDDAGSRTRSKKAYVFAGIAGKTDFPQSREEAPP